jgi:hypothetical protein
LLFVVPLWFAHKVLVFNEQFVDAMSDRLVENAIQSHIFAQICDQFLVVRAVVTAVAEVGIWSVGLAITLLIVGGRTAKLARGIILREFVGQLAVALGDFLRFTETFLGEFLCTRLAVVIAFAVVEGKLCETRLARHAGHAGINFLDRRGPKKLGRQM